jgi:hypothetical protein
MKPVLPDTRSLQELLARTPEELRAEVEAAQRFRQAADTYLAWAQLSEQLRNQVAGLQEPRDAEVIDLVVTGIKAYPATPPAVEVRNGRPSLRRAILALMHTRPDDIWRKREIFRSLQENGWEPRGQKPEAQLATRLAEMIDRGEIERVSLGHYQLTAAQRELREASPSQGGKA